MKWVCLYGDHGQYFVGPIISSAHSRARRNLLPKRMLAIRHRADRSASSAKTLGGIELSSRSMTAFHESNRNLIVGAASVAANWAVVRGLLR